MPLAKAESFIPRGARPAVNPHQNQVSSGRVPQLDHSVWADTFHNQQSRPSSSSQAHPSGSYLQTNDNGAGLQPGPSIPLTRARSAQQINTPSPQSRPRYFYEDYADSDIPSSLYAQSPSHTHAPQDWLPNPYDPPPARSATSHPSVPAPPPPPPRHPQLSRYNNTYTSLRPASASSSNLPSIPQNPDSPPTVPPTPQISYPDEPESYLPTQSSAETIIDRRAPTNQYSHSRPTPASAPPPNPNASSSSLNSTHGNGTDGLRVDGSSSLPAPRRKPSHRSTLSQERGEFVMPFNESETSLDQVGQLIDQLGLDRRSIASAHTPTESVHSEVSRALTEAEEEQELLQNGIAKFQAATLPDQDNEWHRLVSQDFRESLPKNEIQRQSVIFEVIKSERDYVRDLSLVEEVFINPLMSANPPVIVPETRLRTFRNEVFQNITDILARHRVSLEKLFLRQREQHPLISSIADIELDQALEVQPDYEAYIKQYPIAESRHRRELKSNAGYRALIDKALKDPRLMKRGMIDLLTRPVTRLPRISLILEHINKLTDAEHPDTETMPLTLTILNDFVKSTEPGVAVADAKVKFWSLCESLVYRPGEIIDMDLYDPKRHLVYSGTVGRKHSSDWRDVTLSLLDNHVIITSPEVRLGRTYNVLISRPIPLECLGLGSFKDEPTSRKEESNSTSGRILSSMLKPSRPVYGFTIFHRLDVKRRYTFYSERESLRAKWHDMLVDAMAVRQAEQDVNKWYAPEVIDDGTFVQRTMKVPQGSRSYFAGRITGSATWVDGGKTYIAVSTGDGIYAAPLTSKPQFRRVLHSPKIFSLAALPQFHKLVVLRDSTLICFNLVVLVGVIHGRKTNESFEGSMERLSPRDQTVNSFSAGIMNERSLVVYAIKSFRTTSMQALEGVSQPPTSTQSRAQGNADPVMTFRPYGSAFYIPRDVFGITMLQKTLAVSTSSGIAIVEPTQVGHDIAIVPDWSAGSRDSSLQARAMLKERCDASRPLGLVQSGDDELMVIYETFGCYITKHGEPARKHAFVRWEMPIQSFVVREPHVLLVGLGAVEVRHPPTGRLLQIIEGKEIRLLQALPKATGQGAPILIARRGGMDSERGMSDQLVELVPTAPLEVPVLDENGLIWEEWGV